MVKHRGTDEWDRTIPLISRLTSGDRRTRDQAADEVVDWLPVLTDMEALTISFVLACAARLETSSGCLEAQLHALAMMAEREMVTRQVLEHVLAIERDALTGSSLEYYEYFEHFVGGAAM